MTATESLLLRIIEQQPKTKVEFDRVRTSVCAELGIQQPSNRDLRPVYNALIKKRRIEHSPEIDNLLRKASVRSLSGITVVTSLVKPYSCPGKCVYCPTEIRMPKSYIASEPAAARALRLDFSPYEQMRRRIEMLTANGHPTDKIEYIVKGGTWNAYPLKYQYWFILESFRASNDRTATICHPERSEPRTSGVNAVEGSDGVLTMGLKAPSKLKHHTRTDLSTSFAVAHSAQDDNITEHSSLEKLMIALEKEQRKNEKARHRIIGITLETRPDAISPKSIYHMRRLGCTRIELGLQAADDKILALIKRGHTVQQFRDAMYLLRQAGFKVDLHFMPDLPGTTPEHDVEMYKQLFSDPGLKPDMVKIYPNTVIPSAELYQWFLDGRYKPYGEENLFNALLQMKLATPRYCRISRLIRDIPENEIAAGNKITNLREHLAAELKRRGLRCECLRCREIGRSIKTFQPKADPPPAEKHENIKTPLLFVESYETVGGTEYFLSFEDPERNAVYAFLRLRIPVMTDFAAAQSVTPNKTERSSELSKTKFAPNHSTKNLDNSANLLTTLLPEIKQCAFIRELHTYGQQLNIGDHDKNASQHKGLGKKLMAAAEKIACEHGFKKVAVISGVGVRGYYRKLGYRRQGTYMVKGLRG